MNIVLTGFMGTGKSVVGRHVAQELRAPFVDLDAAIVKKSGKSVKDIFTTQGEAAFRAIESEVIVELSDRDKTVIATGGGALLDPKNRERLQENGILVCLSARMGTLLERLKEDLSRPLLAGENPEERIERLMKERQSIYDLCPVQIDTEGKTIAEIADEIIKKVSAMWQA
jgi:shikimate kinase